MNLVDKIIYESSKRFSNLRLGQILTDVDQYGKVSIRWLDEEPGERSDIRISSSFLNSDNEGNVIGIDYGLTKGTIGLFGFIKGQAYLLATVLPDESRKKIKEKIKPNQIKINSIDSSILVDENKIILKCKETSIIIDGNENKIEINAPNGVFINNKRIL